MSEQQGTTSAIRLDVECPTHRVKIDEYGRCDGCREDSIRKMEEYLKERGGGAVTWCPPLGPTQVLLNGKLIDRYHDWAYLERSIPEELYDKVDRFIDAELAAYNCQCLQCQRDRLNEANDE